jgi:hypothetical protein
MRQTVIIALVTASVTALVSIWATSTIIAQSAKGSAVTKISSAVEVMRMMREATVLPEERYDAY